MFNARFPGLRILGCLVIALSACASHGTQGGTPDGTGGGGSPGSAGSPVNGGGSAHGGTSGGVGTAGGSGGAGSPGTSGGAGTSGAPSGDAGSPAGGSAGTDQAGTGGISGSSATGGTGGTAPTGFVCNQVTAMTLTREWYDAGFETFVAGTRWQLKAREHGYITEWSNPNSDFWNEPIESPCAQGSNSPDHVVLTVLSWVPACCTTQAQWQTQITGAINTLKAKYVALRRIDLMTVIRGSGNTLCPTPPAAGETIVIPPELDAALAEAATKFQNFVFVAPKFEAPNCAAFSGGGPHLTTAGNTAVAATIGAYFAAIQ